VESSGFGGFCGRKGGRSKSWSPNLETAGFVDVQETNLKTPIGSWAKDPQLKELGEYTRLSLMSDPEGYILFLANAMGWKREEINVYLAHLRRELKNPKIHAYYRQKIVWARKPEVCCLRHVGYRVMR